MAINNARGLQPLTLTTTQRGALAGDQRPVGLLVFDTDLGDVMLWNGTAWLTIGSAAGTLVFLGTIDVTAVDPPLSSYENGQFYIASAAGAARAAWTGISGTVVAIGDQILYDGSQWTFVPVTSTPTLQTVTDAGSSTTNGITAASFSSGGNASFATLSTTGDIDCGDNIDLDASEGQVVATSFSGNLIGDVLASNGTSTVLDSGTDGTDATFTGSVTGNATTSSSTTGNAGTATALETARNIGGVSFDGTADIDLPGVNQAGNQDTTGNAASATTAAACSGNAATATTATNCSRTITAGNGLSGGGQLNANRTVTVGAGDGISVGSSSVAVNSSVIRTSGNQSMSGTKTFSGRLVYNGSNYLTNKGTANPPASGKATDSGCWLSTNTGYFIGNTNKGAVFGNNNVTDNWTTAVTFINGGSGSAGSIDCKKQQAPRFSSNSDRRLKSNIVDAESMLDKFEALKVRRFTIASPFEDETPIDNCLGFIADELQQVFPDAVTGEPNAVMTVGNVFNKLGELVEENVEDPATSGYQLEDGNIFAASRASVPKYQNVAPAALIIPMAKAIQELIALNKVLAQRVQVLENS